MKKNGSMLNRVGKSGAYSAARRPRGVPIGLYINMRKLHFLRA